MSTDKFHISDATPGHDTHSAVLNRLGYGDLLNRKGHTEFTIDTTKLNKSAAAHGAILGAGTGAAIGAVAGAELAGDKATATTKLLSTLAGTGIGGVGGYFLGSALDTPEDDGLSIADKNTGLLNTIGMGAIGGAVGYGASKYLLGATNKTHHLLSALAGAGLGAGVGTMITDSQINSEHRRLAYEAGKASGFEEEQLERYVDAYTRQAGIIKKDRADYPWFEALSDVYMDYESPSAAGYKAATGSEPDHGQHLKWLPITGTTVGAGALATSMSGRAMTTLARVLNSPSGKTQRATQNLINSLARGYSGEALEKALSELHNVVNSNADSIIPSKKIVVNIPESLLVAGSKSSKIKRVPLEEAIDLIAGNPYFENRAEMRNIIRILENARQESTIWGNIRSYSRTIDDVPVNRRTVTNAANTVADQAPPPSSALRNFRRILAGLFHRKPKL